jgi:hypothetical protein
VGQAPGRLGCGQGGVADGRVLALAPGLAEVVGQPGRRDPAPGVALGLQGGRDPQVQAGAVGGGEAFQDRLAEQVVGEAVRPQRACRPSQHAGRGGLRQQVPHGAGRVAGHPGEQGDGDLRPGDGGRAQQLEAGRAQPGQAPPDRLPDPERDPGRHARGQQPGHLLDEERVAARPPLDVGDHPGAGLAAEQPGHQPGHLVVAERAQRHHRPGGRQVGQQGGGLLAGRLVELAPGADHQDPRGREAAGEEAEQPQRGEVGPLQVVEDHHQRPLLGGRQQHRAELVEQPEPGRLLRLGGGGRRGRGGQLGQQPGRRGEGGGAPPQPLVAGDQRPQHLHPGPVGRRPSASAAAAAASAVLPMPASPVSSTSPPRPAAASWAARRSWASSWSRPTSPAPVDIPGRFSPRDAHAAPIPHPVADQGPEDPRGP